MKRALLISIHPEWAEKILNGEKTIEVRSWIPKGELPLEVLIYVAKRKPYFADFGDNEYPYKSGGYSLSFDLSNIKKHGAEILNGKVVGKFILNKVEDCCDMSATELELKSKLTIAKICDYIKAKEVDPKMVYAWHIDKLEVFDKPKELSEFIHYRQETIYCGMDCPPYTDWVEYPVRKAPQKCAWVYIDEKPEPHQVSVLDEETPSEKDEKERKPF